MLGTSGLPHLRIGVTSAVFHARANVLVKKELFTMRVIVVSVQGRLSLRIREDILSIPGALLDGIYNMVFFSLFFVSTRFENEIIFSLSQTCFH